MESYDLKFVLHIPDMFWDIHPNNHIFLQSGNNVIDQSYRSCVSYTSCCMIKQQEIFQIQNNPGKFDTNRF